MRSWIAGVVAAGLGLAGCGGTKAVPRVVPPEPRDAASAALGAGVGFAGTPGFEGFPSGVVFARFESAGTDAADLQRATFLESNFSDGRYFYLLNARPGTYAAVAARRESKWKGPDIRSEHTGADRDTAASRVSLTLGAQHTRTDVVLFARDAIAASRVEVTPGGFAFLGDLEIAPEPAAGTPDPLQAVLVARVAGASNLGISSSTVQRSSWFGALRDAERNAETWTAFQDATRAALGGSAWLERLAPAAAVQP